MLCNKNLPKLETPQQTWSIRGINKIVEDRIDTAQEEETEEESKEGDVEEEDSRRRKRSWSKIHKDLKENLNAELYMHMNRHLQIHTHNYH